MNDKPIDPKAIAFCHVAAAMLIEAAQNMARAQASASKPERRRVTIQSNVDAKSCSVLHTQINGANTK